MSITSKISEISKIPYKQKCLRICYYTQYWNFKSIEWLVNMSTHEVHAPLNRLTWPTTQSSYDRWEVVQTSKLENSTLAQRIWMSKNIWQQHRHLEKHSLSSSKYQPSSRLVFSSIALTCFSKANFESRITPKIFNSETISTTVPSKPNQGTRAQLYENEKLVSPRHAWIYQHTPPTAPIADHSQIIIQWCCHRWPITSMRYSAKQGRVVSITNQTILK